MTDGRANTTVTKVPAAGEHFLAMGGVNNDLIVNKDDDLPPVDLHQATDEEDRKADDLACRTCNREFQSAAFLKAHIPKCQRKKAVRQINFIMASY